MTRFLTILFALLLTGCATPVIPPAVEESSPDVAGGAAEATPKNIKALSAIAVPTAMGDARAENTSTEFSDQDAISQAGDAVYGFSLTGVDDFENAVTRALEGSEALRAWKGELGRRQGLEPADPAAVAEAIARITEIEGAIRESVSRSGGDLSGLTTLTQTIVNVKVNGGEEGISDAQAESISAAVQGVAKAKSGD